MTFLRHPLSLTLALLISSSSLHAASDFPIEEIIVTSTKRDTPLTQFAGSARVLTDVSSASELQDLTHQVASLAWVDTGARNPGVIIVRGITMDVIDANDLGGDGGTVASYIDNIPLQGYFSPPHVRLKDIEQVEVLRGPQGTLYGNSSIGGLVRYVTVKPDLSTQETRVSTMLSQTKRSNSLNHDIDLMVNAPLIDDVLGLRMVVGKAENSGFIDNPYRFTGLERDINNEDYEQSRVSVRWKSSDRTQWDMSYHKQDVLVDDRQAVNPLFTGHKYHASSRIEQPMQGELELISFDVNHDFDRSTLTASLSRYDYAQHDVSDQTDYLIELGGSYYTDFDDFWSYNESLVDVEKDSAELRFASQRDGTWNYVVGAFYSRDELLSISADVVPGFADFSQEFRPNDLDYLATQHEVLKENSVYGELTYAPTDRTELTFGARHFRYDDDLSMCGALYPTEDGLACDQQRETSSGTLGKVAALHHLNNVNTIYASVSEGYRRGGANLIPASEGVGTYYEEDHSLNYEVGIRSAQFDNHLQLNASIYYIDWSDIQLQFYSDNGYGYWDNAGNAISTGVELEARYHVSDQFSLVSVYDHSRAEINKTIEDKSLYKGDALPGVARDRINLALEFSQPLQHALLEAKITYQYTGSRNTAFNDEYYTYRELPSYQTVDAQIGISFDQWNLMLFVNNLTDTYAVTGARSNYWYREQGQFDYIIRPRTLGLRASVTF